MKKIIPILVILVLVGTLLISGCGTSTIDTGGEFDNQLGVNDINNELNILDADESDFDLSDLDNIGSDLGDL